MKKYKIPISIYTTASHVIGEIECDNVEEYEKLAEKFWEDQDYDAPSTNCTNDFDLGDWELSEIKDDDLKYYANKE